MAKTAFYDKAVIEAIGGKGGNGTVSFRRTRRQPFGGPDGGDGGKGGSVVARADFSLMSLSDYVAKHRFEADAGKQGGSKQCHGANGQDLVLRLPVGTEITDHDTGAVHAELLADGETTVLASGGEGGLGNCAFKSSTNRAPKEAKPGFPGERRTFHLSLRLQSDIGLLGQPNAGKSSFLNAVSNAGAAVSDYPYTTLKPMLGVAELADYSQATVMDLPGVAPGAAQGAGLGADFLSQLSRAKVLLHIVDASSGDPEHVAAQVAEVQAEIKLAKLDQLLAKPTILVLAKIDLLDENDQLTIVKKIKSLIKMKEVMSISSVTGSGINELIEMAAALVRTQE